MARAAAGASWRLGVLKRALDATGGEADLAQRLIDYINKSWKR